MTEEEADWSYFLKYSDIVGVGRDEQTNAVLSLIPAKRSEAFTIVDLGCGDGFLAEKILKKFPKSKVIGIDVSDLMLKEAEKRLSGFRSRIELRKFDLRSKRWLSAAPKKVRCFVSSLAIHHLSAEEKKRLFRNLYKRLDKRGALLIVDLVKPVSNDVRKYFGELWNEMAKKQLKKSGKSITFDKLKSLEWNYYFNPDEGYDKPSGLFEQLKWLEEAGFKKVDCFWMKAGHAVFGGYK